MDSQSIAKTVDTPEPPAAPSNRARRAVPLIAAALAVTVVAGLLYLRPSMPSPASPSTRPSPGPSILEPRYRVEYDFVTRSLGWALVVDQVTQPSRYWVFNTTDGARRWTLQKSDSTMVYGTFRISFFNPYEGYYSLVGNAAFRTSDGGTRWTEVKLPSKALGMAWFVDPTHGWFHGDSDFESTADGGLTWRALPPPPAVGPLIAFRDRSLGWAASIADDAPSTVYSTRDGGASWQPHQLPSDAFGKPFRPAQGLSLLPDRGVMVVLLDDTAYTSLDLGASWLRLAPPPAGNTYMSIAFQDPIHWWAMRDGDLFKSVDAGQTWTHVALQLDGWLYFPTVLDARHAWAKLQSPGPQLSGSALALTSDGGVHWTYANVPRPG